MIIAIILLSVAFLASAYCATFFLILYNEEKEYGDNLRNKLQEAQTLKKQLASAEEKTSKLQRDLEIEKQLRVAIQKRYVSLAKGERK